MSFDRQEFKRFSETRAAGMAQGRMPQLRALVAVTPRMEALTHDDNWNAYCSYLAGIREKLEAARAGAQARLNNPATVGHEEMLTQKIALLVNEAQMQMIDLAMDLPKALLTGADEERQAIEKFEAGS